ncbi:MAG: helix-turn-helix transcriptional regulator [Clostridia bacterium]|nr:helix-turn-helix transcriptional regulator [Clostridia bacterium]
MYSDVLHTLKEADNPRYNRTLSAAMEYIEKHYGENFSMETLSGAMCLSESRLYHLFREELNTTPVKYRCSVRVRHAADDLRLGIYSTEETAFRNGFRSTAYFREAFRNVMGISVSEYRRMLREDRQNKE